MWAYFGPLVQKIIIWAVMKSNGHNITRNGFYDPPKNPDNMYHTKYFMKNKKKKPSKMYDVILRPFWNFAHKKGCLRLPEWQLG